MAVGGVTGPAGAGGTVALPTRPGQQAQRPSGTRPGGATRPHSTESRRLRDPITVWRRVRSAFELVLTTVVLGVLLAAILAAAIGAVVIALQHALNG